MSVATEEKVESVEQNINVSKFNPSDYGCQILLERTTLDAANDKTFPTDARLIWYVVDGTEYIDLTRCAKVVRMFDLYYDRYGKDLFKRLILDTDQSTLSCGVTNLKKKKRKENE